MNKKQIMSIKTFSSYKNLPPPHKFGMGNSAISEGPNNAEWYMQVLEKQTAIQTVSL